MQKLVSQVLLLTFGLDTAALSTSRPLTPVPPQRATRIDWAPSAPADAGACDQALQSGTLPVATVTLAELWPADEALRDVGLGVGLAPACVGFASAGIEVWSDEGDEFDTEIYAPDLFLRAERDDPGDGRVYLILATATSATPVEGRACRTVVVPRTNTAEDLASVRSQADQAQAYCDVHDAAPSAFTRLAEGEWIPPNQPPEVTAGEDQAVELPGNVALEGHVKDDGFPNGTLNVAWTKVSGPGDVIFDQPHNHYTIADFTAPGEYLLRLTADDGALSASDDVRVFALGDNAAPQVDAGPDQAITLPMNTAVLEGLVSDDGQPSGTLLIQWSVVSGPGGVTFANPGAASTTATFATPGVYDLRLRADDTQLAGEDTLRVTVSVETPPVLNAADSTFTEGQDGVSGALLNLSLSKPWPRPVTVDYITTDGTATLGCDYRLRYGTATFAAGETQSTVLVPVVGELVPEPSETVSLLLGNPVEATLARSEALLTIGNDDGVNARPLLGPTRSPADRAAGVSLPPTLSWSASDPDAGDVLSHDVFLGTSFSLDGQSFSAVCPANAGPGARVASVTGYDEAGDRLIVFGGRNDDPQTVWILSNATGAGGAPSWTPIATTGGPGPLREAVSAYDPGSNRLIVYGGCTGDCASPSSQVWVLTGANGLGGTPQWIALGAAGPGPRHGHAAAYDAVSNRLMVFGGSDAAVDHDDVWVLRNANGLGAPAWEALSPTGSGPDARQAMSASYDAEGNRLFVFGGRTREDEVRGDLRVLSNANGAGDTPEWTLIEPEGAPPAPRWGHAAFYEPVSRRLILFGGANGGLEANENFVFGDAWLLEEGASPRWNRLTPSGGAPLGRYQAATAYSASANRLVVALGGNNKRPAHPTDVFGLADAIGSLPLVGLAQSQASLVAQGLTPGATYFWRTRTRDARGAWQGTPTWRFTSNQAPLVDAGPDQVVRHPEAAQLAGAVSDDGLPAGSAIALEWTALSGPGTVEFSNPQAIAPTASFSAPGVYVLRLTASDSALANSDVVSIQVLEGNRAPVVDAGPDQVTMLPQDSVSLSGTVTDDGLPEGSTPVLAWTLVSGPGTVLFSNASAALTSAQFSQAGTYVLRLTASDSSLSGQDDVQVVVHPANQPPVVSAGPAQTVDLGPLVTLRGTVSDDGLPPGSVLAVAWSRDSGPGPVYFANSAAPETTATFERVGTYVLRLSASDGQASGSSTVTITVREARLLPYSSDALRYLVVPGSSPGGGFEQPGFDDSAFGTGGAPFGKDNNGCGNGPRTVWPVQMDILMRATFTLPATDTDLTVGLAIDNDARVFLNGTDISGGFRFTQGCGFRDKMVIAVPRAVLVAGTNLLAVHGRDGGGSTFLDVEVRTTQLSPQNQAPVVGVGPDRAATTPETLRLAGDVHDDGLPSGTVNTSWGQIEGPAPVTFFDFEGSAVSVVFPQEGQYTLRLTANDSQLESHDDVEVTVTRPNQAPVVDAGPDAAVTLPASASLSGTVTDDGLPLSGTLTVAWSKVSGPGSANFTNPASASTSVSFSAAGVYVLRLSAGDGDLAASDDLTVAVSPAGNQAPLVFAGPDQTIEVPAEATLQGTVSDDGLPAGSALSALWMKVSGPGSVRFADPSRGQTSARFGSAGLYVLRLIGSDSVLTRSDELTIQVNGVGGNEPPLVSAGPDSATTLPANTVVLDGAVTDDGRPAGASLSRQWTLVGGPGPVSFADPAAEDTAVTVSAPGTYTLRLSASDTEAAGSDTVTVTVSPEAASGGGPAAAITAPAEGAQVTDRVTIVGMAASSSLAAWQLEHRQGAGHPWVAFAGGTTPVTQGTLGVLDPSLLLNGLVEVRLTAIDRAGRFAQASVRVVVKDNLKVGHFSVSFLDAEVPVAGLPIRLTRTYDSRDKAMGDFGPGWRLDLTRVRVQENSTLGQLWDAQRLGAGFFTYCLQSLAPKIVTVTTPDGRVHEFETVVSPQCQPFVPIQNATVSFRPRPGTFSSLAPLDGGFAWVEASWPGPAQLFDTQFRIYNPDGYRLTLPDGRAMEIDERTGIKALTDLNGNRLTVTPTGITHSSGRGLVFTRDTQGRISAITDPEGRAMTYGYDGNGDLVSFTDREEHTTRFTYHPLVAHHLESIEDPLGRRPLRNEYDDAGRLLRHIDAFGKEIVYTHLPGARQEIVTDRSGKQRVLEYDPRGNVVQETDPEAKVVRAPSIPATTA